MSGKATMIQKRQSFDRKPFLFGRAYRSYAEVSQLKAWIRKTGQIFRTDGRSLSNNIGFTWYIAFSGHNYLIYYKDKEEDEKANNISIQNINLSHWTWITKQ